MRLDLSTPVAEIDKVGKTIADRLKKLEISIVEDLLFYYPFRYEDFSQVSEIADIQPATTATIRGKVEMITNRRSWKKRTNLTEGLVSDKTGSVKVIWFNQPFLTKILKPGDEVYLSGKVDLDKYTPQLINPIYEKVKRIGEAIHTARIVPIYPLTERLTQKQIRWLIKVALNAANQLKDWLPKEVKDRLKLYSLAKALTQIHFPDNQKNLQPAIKRLKFDELFLFLLQSQLIKKELKSAQASIIKFNETKTKEFIDSLPFILTNDQKKAAWQILKDLEKSQPMNRLMEGEVGAGKTVVAAIAMFNVALNNFQSVLMAPTEILAQQHFKNFKKLFAKAKIESDGKNRQFKIALLTRSNQQINNQDLTKTEILKQIKSGKVDLIIGTHALIQEVVEFKNLALIIIDEQHRFGVEQRKILHDKGTDKDCSPHFLSMTATPIPRSLALTLYGDLDLSIIRELPKERKKIVTKIVEPKNREQSYNFIRDQVKAGHQVFVICPLIDPSDKLGVKSVSEEYEKLNDQIFPDLKIAKLHGKLKPAEKEKIMVDFLAKKSQILVATSVVEVGIDVPNATVMLIEGAERFGLAQLYQFRGRVGRSTHQSYCFLATDKTNQKTKTRLQALVTAKDTFELAEVDLELRGPGEIFGVTQSGWPEFRIASLFDQPIINLAQTEAKKIVQQDPKLDHHPLLKEKITELNKPVHLE